MNLVSNPHQTTVTLTVAKNVVKEYGELHAVADEQGPSIPMRTFVEAETALTESENCISLIQSMKFDNKHT